MKSLKFLLTLALITFMVATATKPIFAQDFPTQKLQGTTTYISVPLTAEDTIKASETWYGIFKSYRNSAATQDVLIKLKDLSGTPNIGVILYGRKFETAPWVSIGTMVASYKGGGTDSTIVFSNATANRYREYKVEAVATSAVGKVQVMQLEFKEYNEGQ